MFKPSRATKPRKRRLTWCIDFDRELRAAEIVALGGNPECRHFACKTGKHPGHKACRGKR